MINSFTFRLTFTKSVLFFLVFSFFSKAQDVAKGKDLFQNNCASCHAITDAIVIGPGLKGIETRRNEAWLLKWIRNSQAVIQSGDSYAVALYNKYNKAAMTSFPNLSDADIKNILAYAKVSEAKPAGETQGNGATSSTKDSSDGGFFQAILVVLLLIMVAVWIALLLLLNILGKHINPDSQEFQLTFQQKIARWFQETGANPTFRSIAFWISVLLIGKAAIDGMYAVGISQGYAPKQPIEFSHKLHAGDYKINCNYCHTGVYTGKGANIPSANICMNCHGVIKKESPEIQKIYTAIEKNEPIEWVRVHNLPDLAYFNHAQHTNVGGLDCKNCHGEVEQMEVIQQKSSLTMGWCIDCHRQTNVNGQGNEYYDKLLAIHKEKTGKKELKVKDIGGLECGKCHY